MEHAFAEMPLAVFTTFAPIGAGAFIALALAFLTTTFSDEVLAKIDRLTWVPVVLVIIGFGASFLHLVSTLNAIHALAGIGTSPLSNEIAVGSVFVVLALVYLIIAMANKMTPNLRKGLSCLVAIGALVFAIFTGLAYAIETIPSWNSIFVPLSLLGFALAGGALFGTWIIAVSGGLPEVKEAGSHKALIALTAVGAVLAIAAVSAHVIEVSALSSMTVSGSALVQEALPFLIMFVAGILIAAMCGILVLTKTNSVALVSLGVLLALIAVLGARLLFYALQLSIGL